MKKRLLSIILSMTMCISALPMMVFADVTEYNLWVNGAQFTSDNLIIKCGDGTAEYNPNLNELTLTNAKITNPYLEDTGAIGIYTDMEQYLTVNVVGTNTIDFTGVDFKSGSSACGIYYDYSYGLFKLIGNGSLNIDLNSDNAEAAGTISIISSCALAIDGVSINCAASDWGIIAAQYLYIGGMKEFKVAASVPTTLIQTYDLNCDFDDFEVYVADNEDGQNAVLWNKEGSINDYKYVSMELVNYGVWVNGEQFTRDTKEIKCGDGTATYNYDRNELTLNDAVITKACDIEYFNDGIHSNHNLNIIAEGTNSIEIDDCDDGIYVFGYLTLSGTGSLDITLDNIESEKYNYGIFVSVGFDNLIDMDGKLTVKSVDDGIHSNGIIFEGNGDIEVISLERHAVNIVNGSMALNGKNSNVEFTSADGKMAVRNDSGNVASVGGNNIGKYDVEGAPEESSVKYTLRTYNVTFDMGGHGTAPENQAVMEDDIPEIPSDPTADGFKFEGWYSDRACTKEFDFEVAYNVDMTVFAKWTCLHANTEVKDAKASTLTEKGYTGDTYCKDCGELIKKGKEIPTLTPDPTTDPKPTGEPTPTVPPTTPTPAPELNVGDFVDRCYEVALGREADEDGYNYWKDQLTNGEACGAQVGFGFIFSAEYINKNTTNEQFVTDMYSMFFGREADEAGYNYWLEQLNNGTATREQVFAGFANSEEFFNLCSKYGVVSGAYLVGVPNDQQGGVNCFVARLYKVCLNRLPDMGGQAGWVMQLMSGEVTGSTCAYGFVFSPEFVNMNLDNVNFVNYMYKAFFGREADETGLNYWVEQLNAGTATRKDVFAGFTGSAEFANLCASYGINA